jgi:hypothetical protein
VLTPDDLATMEQAARRFSGAYTGTSGTLAGYVILLLKDRARLVQELAVERARRQDA